MSKPSVTRICKDLKSIVLRISFALKEKEYKSKENTIHYLYYPYKGSKHLCVIFSGFAGHEVRARYNYIRTLKNTNCNKLFILDDFGYHSVGSYYLGDSMSLYESNEIVDLINFINKDNLPLTFIGSSKGGTASLIYGFRMNVNNIVIGSPQYMIGNYLSQNDYHLEIMNSIIKGTCYTPIMLDRIIDREYKVQKPQSRIWLMYSSKESSYDDDVKYFINNYHKNIYNSEDLMYTSHDDTGKYFIPYLTKVLDKILNEEN